MAHEVSINDRVYDIALKNSFFEQSFLQCILLLTKGKMKSLVYKVIPEYKTSQMGTTAEQLVPQSFIYEEHKYFLLKFSNYFIF